MNNFKRPERISLYRTLMLAFLGMVLCSGFLLSHAWTRDPVLLESSSQSTSIPLIGFPSRDPNLDVLPGFQNPPPGYGEVAFYWWLGDPLTKERLAWQIQQLKDMGVLGLQVNYAHSDRGGLIYGLTFPSEPPLFSEEWWDLFNWFLQEAKKNGMSVSLSDYTLGVGQGWFMDEILKEHPDLCGSTLSHESLTIRGDRELTWKIPENSFSVSAHCVEDTTSPTQIGVDLRPFLKEGILRWQPPTPERWKVTAIIKNVISNSLDPMNPQTGPQVIEKFFQRFEDRNPGEAGSGLNFFFSDELDFGVQGNLWTEGFAEEFLKRKGYDLAPQLPAIFTDIGPQTPKIRLDYHDVLVSLQEEGYFKPVFNWHNQRGMLYGCDHGGRGLRVDEFGDYFRTQRWMTGPGCDQPFLQSKIIKNKVASSIAHLYERPRTWLEGFHSSGWSTNLDQLSTTTFKNYVMGQNLLTLHGLYYSTHGGWWEWAPPCNHFRMPYWAHMREYMKCVERLSYLLSQGYHRCDVAILYPVAPVEADMNGASAVNAAFRFGEYLYMRGTDFDFIDFESVARAEVQDRHLQVSGESYKILVLPSMSAIRFSTLQKALEFYRQGGIVVALGALPEASDRAGRDDPELDAMVKEIFSQTAKEVDEDKELLKNRNEKGGLGLVSLNAEPAFNEMNQAITRDFIPAAENVYVMHRVIGSRHAYMVYGATQDSLCFFRAKGRVELWDPWTGATRPLHAFTQNEEGTTIRMPLDANEAQIIVFNPEPPQRFVEETSLNQVIAVHEENQQIVVTGTADTEGEKTATINVQGQKITLRGTATTPKQIIPVEGDWQFELIPTMNNQWGDFRWPPSDGFIGAEARQFRYADEGEDTPNVQDPHFDDSKWPVVTSAFGARFWKLGPFPATTDTAAIEQQLTALQQLDPTASIKVGDKEYSWSPYSFSWRWGIEGDPGHQGYHGLKGEMHDELIGLGKLNTNSTDTSYSLEEGGSLYYLWSTVLSNQPQEVPLQAGGLKPLRAWLNHNPLDVASQSVILQQGANPLLLRYDRPGRGYIVFGSGIDNATPTTTTNVKSLATRWHNNPGILPFDIRPQDAQPAGWYRFVSPPALRSMTLVTRGTPKIWVNGQEAALEELQRFEDGTIKTKATIQSPWVECATVAIRIEQERGCYGGAALPEPIALDCGVGNIPLGDWSKIDGLASYSGGAWYRKDLQLTPTQVQGQVILDLGNVVASAEVRVNGQSAGIRVAAPWKFDLSKLVHEGENRIEILVYNTLANHYLTIPTRYRGDPISGLIGPVNLEVREIVRLQN